MPQLGFEVKLNEDYEAAIVKVTEALKAEGFGVLNRIDAHSTLKEKIGADFRPYAILGACNPQLAYRALSSEPQVGLLLPCNVTVEAERQGEGSLVRIVDPQMLLQTGDLAVSDEIAQIAAEAHARLKRVAEALQTSEI